MKDRKLSWTSTPLPIPPESFQHQSRGEIFLNDAFHFLFSNLQTESTYTIVRHGNIIANYELDEPTNNLLVLQNGSIALIHRDPYYRPSKLPSGINIIPSPPNDERRPRLIRSSWGASLDTIYAIIEPHNEFSLSPFAEQMGFIGRQPHPNPINVLFMNDSPLWFFNGDSWAPVDIRHCASPEVAWKMGASLSDDSSWLVGIDHEHSCIAYGHQAQWHPHRLDAPRLDTIWTLDSQRALAIGENQAWILENGAWSLWLDETKHLDERTFGHYLGLHQDAPVLLGTEILRRQHSPQRHPQTNSPRPRNSWFSRAVAWASEAFSFQMEFAVTGPTLSWERIEYGAPILWLEGGWQRINTPTPIQPQPHGIFQPHPKLDSSGRIIYREGQQIWTSSPLTSQPTDLSKVTPLQQQLEERLFYED